MLAWSGGVVLVAWSSDGAQPRHWLPLHVFLDFLCDFIWCFFFFAWFSALNSDWLDQMQGRCWFCIGFFCGFMVVVEVGVAVMVVGVVGRFWVLFGWVTVGLLLGSWVATGLLWWWFWCGSTSVVGGGVVCCNGGFGVVVLLLVGGGVLEIERQ